MLSNAKQDSAELPENFVIRLNLRQKFLFISKVDPCTYDERLVQRKFWQAVFKSKSLHHEPCTLLKNENVCNEELLEALSLGITTETEH